jgi:hypothetical protein
MLLAGSDSHRLSNPTCHRRAGLGRWLRAKEKPEYLSEYQFFHYDRDCDRENQARDYRHECDCELHMIASLQKVLAMGRPVVSA